jgi:hypothetical protein
VVHKREVFMNVRGSMVESSEVREEMQEEIHSERDEVLERILQQREQHLDRSVLVRVGIVVAGGTLSIAGLLLLIAPEFGLPLLLLGLRLLALEFDWAARAYARVARLARRVGGRLRTLLANSKRAVVLTVAVAVPAVGLLIWLALV